jgi:isopentenyldiphosphate isomerase
MSAPDLITIVDARDNVIGSEERKIARQKGLHHRMVKVIISNPRGEILLQQRSADKAESPLLWDLSATGHVDADEDYLEAALRETGEEVGISQITLKLIGKYYYERQKGTLTLRRFNGIFAGQTDQSPAPDPHEVAQIKWIAPKELRAWIETRPNDFTTSLKEIFERFGTDTTLYRETVDHSASN